MSDSSLSVNTKVIYEQVIVPENSKSPETVESFEWPSLEDVALIPPENPKMVLSERGLYFPGSGEICAKQIALSSSSVTKHPYYAFPAVVDPGIEEALLGPIPPKQYPDDGRELYQVVCDETNTCPVGLFYRNLLNSEVNVSYYGVTSKGVRAMALALQFNKHVKRLNLTENFLDKDACYHLGEILRSNVTLEELILTGCRIDENGLAGITAHLRENRSLVTLGLSRNSFGDNGGVYLAKQFSLGSTVQRLDLSKNKLGSPTAIALAEAFDYCRLIITHLDLSWNCVTHMPTAVKLLQQIATCDVLEELNLSWNSLEGQKVAVALRDITTIPTLRLLDISNNRLKDEAVEIIIEHLTKAKHLRTLDLSYNLISPVGALAVLKKMLRPRVKLENLLLEKICVYKDFLDCLKKVKEMKNRSNFVVKFGEVVQNWTIKGSDPRELILQRAACLGNMRKHPVDVPLYLLKLSTEFIEPVDTKILYKRAQHDNVPLDDDLITEMSAIFSTQKKGKSKTPYVNLQAVVEFIHRMWPDKTLANVSAMNKSHHSKTKLKKTKEKYS